MKQKNSLFNTLCFRKQLYSYLYDFKTKKSYSFQLWNAFTLRQPIYQVTLTENGYVGEITFEQGQVSIIISSVLFCWF